MIRVSITNTLSRTLVGMVYSCDQDLVLSTGPFDYYIIPLSKISRYEALSRDESPPSSLWTKPRKRRRRDRPS
jgi:hypothetical protein